MKFYPMIAHCWPIIIHTGIVFSVATALLLAGLSLLRGRSKQLLLPLVVVLMAVLAVSIVQLRDAVVLTRERSALAVELGVDLNRWPWPTSFPASYFASILKVGTPRKEIHQVVRGYKRVLYCEPDSRGYRREIYYFYTDLDGQALRMQIEYDSQGHLVRLQAEDPNSRIFSTTNCQSGRWGD